MGLGRKLTDAALAKLKQVEAVLDGEDLSKLTPAQREHHDMWTARTEQARGGGPVIDGRLVGEPLFGPAGEVLQGVVKAPDLPDRIEDPGQWEQVMLAERATREAARAPYLAQTRSPIHISRVATLGETQARELAEYLGASGLAGRPDLVYGVYRVPDRIGTGAGGEKRRVVEWDVVHAADGPLAPAAPAADAYFDAEQQWVARRPGEPSVLDEDLALAYLARAGIPPEHTLGVARHCEIESADDDGRTHMTARVVGVHAFYHAGVGQQHAPPDMSIDVGAGPPEGTWLELINWDAVARAVHPVRQQRPLLPSPFAYLPLAPQELLRAYLEIVGIAPHDSYGVQVTYNRPVDLLSRTSTAKWITVRRTTGGDEVLCADGERHVRMHGGSQIVVVYRDSPAHAEGRQRWASYQSGVLKADLSRRIHPRPPVPKKPQGIKRMLDRAADVAAVLDGENPDTPARPRYCWPPV